MTVDQQKKLPPPAFPDAKITRKKREKKWMRCIITRKETNFGATMKTPQDKEALIAMLNELDNFFLVHLPGFLMLFAEMVLFPALKLAIAFGVGYKIIVTTQRHIFPPSASEKHQEAKELYQKGSVKKAIRVWVSLDLFGNSYLSRACHEIYVKNDPAKGVAILKEAEERKVSIDEKRVKMMKSDALAILNGNSIMIHTNATLAKEEYLGVVDW